MFNFYHSQLCATSLHLSLSLSWCHDKAAPCEEWVKPAFTQDPLDIVACLVSLVTIGLFKG